MTTNDTQKPGALALAMREADKHGSAVVDADTLYALLARAEQAETLRADVARLREALDELVAEHDAHHSQLMDEQPGYGWPNETGGMLLARAALAATDPQGGAK